MKKRLLFLPLIAGMALCSCEIEIFGLHIGGGSNTGGTTDASILEEFQGYKLAKSVKDGGKYLLGVYRVNEDLMRFASGNYHTDENGEYPFYMGTVGGTTSGAAEITVKMLGHGEFSMQVSAPGKVWDQKYIGVYAATSSFNNTVMSIALLDDPDQTSYSQGGKSYSPKGRFKFFEEYDGAKQYAPGVMFQYPGVDEEEVPKFLGSGHNADADTEGDYISIDCKSYEVALQRDAYDLGHLYEKK